MATLPVSFVKEEQSVEENEGGDSWQRLPKDRKSWPVLGFAQFRVYLP